MTEESIDDFCIDTRPVIAACGSRPAPPDTLLRGLGFAPDKLYEAAKAAEHPT